MDLDFIIYFMFGILTILTEMYHLLMKCLFSTSHSSSSSKDRGTFVTIWLTVIVSIVITSLFMFFGYGWKIFVSSFARFLISLPLALFLVILGLWIRQAAIKQLGVWFTMTIRIDAKQQLIDSGLYSYVRHPGYAGVLVYVMGLVLLSNNWLSLFILFVPIMLAFLYRVRIEEYELRGYFGSKYNDYARKVPFKLVPYIF